MSDGLVNLFSFCLPFSNYLNCSVIVLLLLHKERIRFVLIQQLLLLFSVQYLLIKSIPMWDCKY